MSTKRYIDASDYVQGTCIESETSHLFESVAIPDDGYTIEDLLQRHKEGLLTNLGPEPVYTVGEEDDYDAPDVEKMAHADFVERAEFIEKTRNTLKMVEKMQADEKLKAEQAALNSSPPTTP